MKILFTAIIIAFVIAWVLFEKYLGAGKHMLTRNEHVARFFVRALFAAFVTGCIMDQSGTYWQSAYIFSVHMLYFAFLFSLLFNLGMNYILVYPALHVASGNFWEGLFVKVPWLYFLLNLIFTSIFTYLYFEL